MLASDPIGSRPFEEVDASDGAAAVQAWLEKFESESRKAIHPIVRLTDDGIDWGAPPGPGDEIGYGMHPYRTDDCLRAAIATATQIPIEQVPDLRLDQRLEAGEDPEEIARASWNRLSAWAAVRELTVRFWPKDALPPPRRRWVGVANDEGQRGQLAFGDHCPVMCKERLIFNPDCSVVPPPGSEVATYYTNAILYGISFDKEE